jgi:hypothetical protein
MNPTDHFPVTPAMAPIPVDIEQQAREPVHVTLLQQDSAYPPRIAGRYALDVTGGLVVGWCV